MGKDGGNPRVISGETRNLVDPQWSPTDEIIAFVQTTSLSLHENNPPISDIFLSSPGGDLLYQVTDNPTMMNHTIEEIQWSPDGKRIAFSTGGFAGSVAHDIYVVNSDGSGLRRLSFPPALNYSPRWSPDGRQVAYYSVSDEFIIYLVIVTLNDEGAPETRIPLRIGGDLSWSPDGQSLMYDDSTPDLRGDYDIHVYDLNKAQDDQLTSGDFVEFQPLWSEDGSIILFTSNLDGNFDLYTMNRDGSGVIQQVDNSSDAFIHNPIWASDGKTIYFFLSGGRKDIYEMWAVDLVEYCE
jgi:Tol biopolymer transport system component